MTGKAAMAEAVTVRVNDRMQQGYAYALVAPMGVFDPAFAPELSPKEMLALGVFGGCYMTDCRAEFPADWFADARLSPGRHDKSLNHFGVLAGQPLAEWRRKGWIHPDDPRGWFQWYCRYFMGPAHGRRCPADRPLARLRPPRRADPRPLRAGRSLLPPAPAPGAAAMGL